MFPFTADRRFQKFMMIAIAATHMTTRSLCAQSQPSVVVSPNPPTPQVEVDAYESASEFGGGDFEAMRARYQLTATNMPHGLVARGPRSTLGYLGADIRISEHGLLLGLSGGLQIDKVILRADLPIFAVYAGVSSTGSSTNAEFTPRALGALRFEGGYRIVIGDHLLTPKIGLMLPTAVGSELERDIAAGMQVWNRGQWIDSHLGLQLGTSYLLRDSTLLLRGQGSLDVLVPSSGGQETELLVQAMIDVGYRTGSVFSFGLRTLGFVMPTDPTNAAQLALEPFVLVEIGDHAAAPTSLRAGFLFNVDDPWGPSFASANSRYAVHLSAEVAL